MCERKRKKEKEQEQENKDRQNDAGSGGGGQKRLPVLLLLSRDHGHDPFGTMAPGKKTYDMGLDASGCTVMHHGNSD